MVLRNFSVEKGRSRSPSREVQMKHCFKIGRLVCLCITVVFGVLAAAQFAFAQSSTRGAIVQMDRGSLTNHFKSMGHRRLGGISKAKTNKEENEGHFGSLIHFSSSFTVGGVTFPFTMLGHPPRSGRKTEIRSVIVPLRMHFVGFGPNGDINVDFDPTPAVNNILASPIYQDASFANGIGQFNEMEQRATFFNKMDPEKEWSVRFARPRVMHPVDIRVTPETANAFDGLVQVGPNAFFGDVLFDFMDAEIRTIIELGGIDPDEVPIFVTDGVTNEALGYHNAITVANDDGTERFQAYIFTSWLDPALVDPIVADISTINHETGELFNDPFVNNVVPTWMYPPPGDPRTVCSGNNLLEVGDPEGNGPTFDDFPTVVVPLNGFPYHLQDLVLLPWFTEEVPSSAQNGWYDFPATTDITVPAVYCP
jgi:hypothetical protein